MASVSEITITVQDMRLVIGHQTFNPALIAAAEYDDGSDMPGNSPCLTIHFANDVPMFIHGKGAALAWERMTHDRIDLADVRGGDE